MPVKFKFKNPLKGVRLTISGKLRLAFGAIVTILIVTTAISIFEYRRLSTYVSDLISGNITTINLSTELALAVDEYNIRILNEIGRADEIVRSGIDTASFAHVPDNILKEMTAMRSIRADSVKLAYERYYAVSLQLDEIIASDFVDTREWYFKVLQPEYNRFRNSMDSFNVSVYDDLKKNSVSFDESFYRGIAPSVVSVAMAIILCLLLQFFIIVYYVKPLRRMLKSVDAYKHSGVAYSYTFEGDDELQKLNGEITELAEDNVSLKKRLRGREL